VSEELRQKGYIGDDGLPHGDRAGEFESFNLGASSLGQLARAGIVPEHDYGSRARLKPDALVVSRNGVGPRVRLVAEFKDRGILANEARLEAVVEKVAAEYCAPLGCPLAVVSDGATVRWVTVDTKTQIVRREDGYPLEAAIELGTEAGRLDAARTIKRIRDELDPASFLKPPATVDPTRLADQTWQAIWLASGENPERCLASFIEVLLFKFLSDLGTLNEDHRGCPTTFEHVADLRPAESLRYYFEVVRPQITRLFPAGRDGTAVIGGLVLRPDNVDHGRLFAEILRNFREAEPLKRINPEFKSRIYERFLKKSISRKSWGQYFTPRNVVKAVVEMSGIEHLAPGEIVADPFCGVGGFVLEPLVHKRPHDFRARGSQPLRYHGYDRDPKTIALAKANMLIHLSEVLEKDPELAPEKLASLLNETFQAMDQSITGSLALAPREKWDLVMTNPPYVVTGTTTQRKMLAKDARLANYYSVPGAGVENLCLQEIIAGLKPGRRALVIVPDGILMRHSEEALRRHLLRRCFLEAIVSLPKDTFYSTPKKTYVLVFRKKPHPDERQETGVFTYLAGEIGETRDAKRFTTAANDLPAMVSAFKRFQASPGACGGESPTERIVDRRARVEPIGSFLPEEHWLVDRWRSEAERRALGELDESETISADALGVRLREVSATLRELGDLVTESSEVHGPLAFSTVSLSDPTRFRLSIGRRVLKQELLGRDGAAIPLYSANVTQPFGHVQASNIGDFNHPSVLWGIDGDFHLAVKEAGVEFATTDHCGRIEILDDRLNAAYCRAALALARAHGFDRTLRPSLRRVKALEIKVPVGPDGEPDPMRQKALAREYDSVIDSLAEAATELGSLASLQPEVMFRADTEDWPPQS
jgi:type I restriction enzyme M protein